MAYRKNGNIDDEIIRATIELGGSSDPNCSFTTKDIADRCGVREFLIFNHFGNKENLMHAADLKVGSLLAGEAKTILNNPKHFPEFFNEYLDWLLTHPETVFFAINYGHEVPHATDIFLTNPANDEAIVKADAEYIFNHFEKENEILYTLMWKFLLREMIYTAAEILSHEKSDTPSYRLLQGKLIDQGLSFFDKEERK